MSDPEAALRHTRSVTPDGARRLAMLLAGFLPGEQMIAARRHVAALLGTAGRARPPGGGASGLARIGMLAPGVPENRLRHSPFEYPDFGRRFVPAFYLPGDTLAGLCAATKLRSSVRPPAVPARRIATPGRPCLPSPSPGGARPVSGARRDGPG